MNRIDARHMYMRWLDTNHPNLYNRTITPVLKAAMSTRPANHPLGDWIDDMLAAGNSIPSLSVDTSSSSDASGLWNNILSSVTSLGSQYVNTQAAKQLIDLNTQRVRSGLPPVDQSGNIITSNMLAAQSGNYANLQRWLATQGSGLAGVPTWAWVAGGGLLLIILMQSARGN